MYRRRFGGSAFNSPADPQTDPKSTDDPVLGIEGKKFSNRFSRKPIKMSTRNHPAAGKKGGASSEDLSHPTVSKSNPQRQQSAAPVPKDLMISYSHADKDMMIKVREKLEQNGITVWVDVSGLQAGVDFLSKIGEAIIDAKLFISLLSINCVQSRYCQDELALAYVSDTGIFPVAIEDPANFKSKMDTGMKLQLARYEWTLLGKDDFDEVFDTLIDKMKAELKRRKEQDESEKGKEGKGRPKMERAKSRTLLNKTRESEASARADATGIDIMPEKFWKDSFSAADVVDFEQFYGVLNAQFKEQIDEYFGSADQEWLKAIMHRELEVEEDGKLYKYNFDSFCMIDGMPKPVWERLLNQAMESYAMKDVFNMESSVRVEAIENLGKFRSAAVIDALRDLLSDADANVRSVAAVSLARTEANDPVTLKFLSKTLNDKDRLVREAGCLALGHLQARQAVSKLLHLWRNDVISHVREAAQVALQQIGGPEVEKAMHVTKVLADEIRQLTKQ
ncbi:uncharacterized protein LOC143288361 isoform X2 [Babylonia areolata]|uniref:uncharacterized protein LOC143288361 isoform X2 n=1 Tax=Babylonia areolata TaxID=304850 RepID=UPI003FD2B1C8